MKIVQSLPDGRQVITAFNRQNDVFGFTEAKQYTYSAAAVEAVQFCRFEHSTILQTMHAVPAFGIHLLRIIGRYLNAAQQKLVMLGHQTADERLAAFLVEWSCWLAKSKPALTTLALPMRRRDIADHLGIATETVSRCIGELRDLGLISIHHNGRVHVRDPNGLARLAGLEEP